MDTAAQMARDNAMTRQKMQHEAAMMKMQKMQMMEDQEENDESNE